MAVTFTPYGRLYYLDAGDHRPRVGDHALVPTDGGDEVAQCGWAPQGVDEEIGGLGDCAGIATDADFARGEEHRARRAETRVAARRLIREAGLPMKLLGVDWVVRDERKIATVYFSA